MVGNCRLWSIKINSNTRIGEKHWQFCVLWLQQPEFGYHTKFSYKHWQFYVLWLQQPEFGYHTKFS